MPDDDLKELLACFPQVADTYADMVVRVTERLRMHGVPPEEARASAHDAAIQFVIAAFIEGRMPRE